MAIEKVAGSNDPVETGWIEAKGSEAPMKVVIVEGPMSILTNIDSATFLPADYVYDSMRITPTGDGFGKVEITYRDFGTTSTESTATRTTWRIQMACVQTDLKYHPTCVSARDEIERWLTTDIGKRYKDGDKTKPQYIDENGNPQTISADGALKYVKAYNAGVETYNRYYPILQKISYYKRLPGVTMSDKSTTSGTVKSSDFSSDIGKWSVPAVKLPGYADTGWFKSGDDYTQDNSLKWTRTEEWTWSPKGSGDDSTGWIYQSTAS